MRLNSPPNGTTNGTFLLAINSFTYSGTELLRKLSTGRGGYIRRKKLMATYARSAKRQKRKEQRKHPLSIGSSSALAASSSRVSTPKLLSDNS